MNKFIGYADEWKRKIAWLKSQSYYYPNIFPHIDGDTAFLSTLVRIKRDGRWYYVHCVESCIADKAEMAKFFTIFIESVHRIIHLYQITGDMEDLDPLQIDETERMRRQYEKEQNIIHNHKQLEQ